MPQLNLEYSSNLKPLDVDTLLLRMNHTLVASGQFNNEVDIKARALAFDQYRVGVAPQARAFVHVRLSLLSGRSSEIKRQLSEALFGVLTETVSAKGIDLQFSVDIVDMDRDTYTKGLIPA